MQEAAVVHQGEDKMKRKVGIIKYLLVLPVALLLGGCYTVLWMPNSDTAQLPANQYDNNGYDFYNQDYYGGYWSYYNTPWWVGPVNSYTPYSPSEPSRSSDVQNLRDNTGGRNDVGTERPAMQSGSAGRNSSGNDNIGKQNNNSNNSPANNNSNTQNTQTRSQNNSGNNNSLDNNALRNNNGSRNSGSGRR